MAAADSDSGASANIALYNNQSESIVFLNGPIHGVASGGYINGTLSLYGNFAGDSFSASMPEAIDLSEATLAVGTGTTVLGRDDTLLRSEEHTSELQSLMRISYAVFCLKKKNTNNCIVAIITSSAI